MKGIIKVLVVTALMVVLMATTVSPAFAMGWGKLDQEGYYVWKPYGFGADGENTGWKCGHRDQQGDRLC